MRVYALRLAAAAAALLSVGAAQAEASDRTVKIDVKPGKVVSRSDCGGKFPRKGKLGGAFLHVWNQTCWSCPTGYKRSINPDVASGGACVKHGGWVHSRAKRHNKATGLLRTDCPKGSRQFWHIGDGYCYSCPKGYVRHVTGIKSAKACIAKNRDRWAKGTKRGTPGCPRGTFKVSGNRCVACPDGMRVVGQGLFGKKLDMKRACRTIVAKNFPGMSSSQRNKVDQALKEHGAMIKQAAVVATKLAKHKAEVKGYIDAKKPLPPALKAKVGLPVLEEKAEDKGFKSITTGLIFDASILMGGSTSNGLVWPIKGDAVRAFNANTWTICCSLGADVGLEVGVWNAKTSTLAGDSQGVTFGGSYYAGAAITLLFGYCPDQPVGCFAEFQGFAVVPSGGFSVELEYVRGTTNVTK